jgi:hypothetical protein
VDGYIRERDVELDVGVTVPDRSDVGEDEYS